jgi:hypothetical protein
MTKAAKRQHFVARFYLRNFAEPMFSDNLRVYDIRKRRWETRTPDGVGWSSHLCSLIEMDGKRTDDFDRFLKLSVEDPAVPAIKSLATGAALGDDGRSAVAMFIALTAARSPEMMKGIVSEHRDKLSTRDQAELDALVRIWCAITGKPCDSKAHDEFLKPSTFGAIWFWSLSLRDRLVNWNWHVVQTTRTKPFVTSDRPVYTEWESDQNLGLVSFPVSTEFALIVTSGGCFNEARDRTREAFVINRQTMERACEFVVACEEGFPGDDHLLTRAQLAAQEPLSC